jgi:hypothetical protein
VHDAEVPDLPIERRPVGQVLEMDGGAMTQVAGSEAGREAWDVVGIERMNVPVPLSPGSSATSTTGPAH